MHAVQPPVMGLHGGSLLQEGCPVERQEVLTVHFQGKAMQLQQLAQKRLLQGTNKTVVSKTRVRHAEGLRLLLHSQMLPSVHMAETSRLMQA